MKDVRTSASSMARLDVTGRAELMYVVRAVSKDHGTAAMGNLELPEMMVAMHDCSKIPPCDPPGREASCSASNEHAGREPLQALIVILAKWIPSCKWNPQC